MEALDNRMPHGEYEHLFWILMEIAYLSLCVVYINKALTKILRNITKAQERRRLEEVCAIHAQFRRALPAEFTGRGLEMSRQSLAIVRHSAQHRS